VAALAGALSFSPFSAAAAETGTHIIATMAAAIASLPILKPLIHFSFYRPQPLF
jgi:hypothetical protein